MRKFYLLGSKNVKGSLILMALAVGTAQGLQAQTCTNVTAGACQGSNVSANFNTNSAGFTPGSFTYNSGAGNFQRANSVKNSSYVITSGLFRLPANSTGGTIGFSAAGTTGTPLDNVTVRVLSSTNTVLYTCTASFQAANQICVTYTISPIATARDVKFEFTLNTVNGAAGDNQTIIFDNFALGAAGAAPLPVKLDNFDAAKEGAGVKLSWKASEEAGVATYQVQRSADGINFSTIGSVSADGKKSYTYLDVVPTSGNNFYRLRILDVDNSAKVSHIVSLKSKVAMAIEAYPNPVRDRMVVQHPKAISGTRLQLISLSGQVLRDVQVPANAVVTPMDVTGLSNGTYYIMFRSGSESFSQRITKQ